jgi:hypothetical protein
MRRLLVVREEVQLEGEEAWKALVGMVDDELYQDLRALLSALANFDA